MPSTEPNSLVVLVSVTVVLISALYLKWKNGKKRGGGSSKLPPGYTGWPLIGEILPLQKPCRSNSLGDFMEHRIARFGKIFSTKLLGQTVVVSADAELNRFVFQNEMRLFEYAWPPTFRDLMGKTNIGLQMGDAHRQLRSIFINFFSTARLRTSWLQDAEQLATALLSTWKDGSVVSAVDAGKQFTFNVIVKNALSMEPGGPETEKLREYYENLTIGHFIIPLNLPGTRYNKSLKSRNNVLKVFRQIMKERRNAEGNVVTEEDDLPWWIMKNTSLSEEQIGDFLQGTIFAGEETTSKAIPMVIYFLEGCPKAHEQLREEHLQIVRLKRKGGQHKLTWEDYKQMEFTKCVINEALRLGNIARFLQKKASTDIQFKGFEIPRGCRVLIHVAAVHLDSSIFEDPEQFNPWRWLSSSGTTKTENFMPFGGGPRLCLGMELARLEIAVFLHHLILNYNWKLVEDDHPIALPRVNFPKGLPMKIYAVSQVIDDVCEKNI